MNDETLRALGKLVPEGMQRDAVHVAVVPVVAGDPIAPGERCYVSHDGRAVPVNRACTPVCEGVGVADPWLLEAIEEGQRFWLLLHPGSITSLRHEWHHPAFAPPVPMDHRVAASEAWLRRRADEWGVSYQSVIDGAIDGDVSTGRHEERDAGTPEFWMHVSVVTGRTFDASHIENTFFSCSC